jgi:hypothetical protein
MGAPGDSIVQSNTRKAWAHVEQTQFSSQCGGSAHRAIDDRSRRSSERRGLAGGTCRLGRAGGRQVIPCNPWGRCRIPQHHRQARAVIYTAFHVDHINGVKAFVSAQSVKAGQVAIIAHETLMTNVIRSSATIGPIFGVRTA